MSPSSRRPAPAFIAAVVVLLLLVMGGGGVFSLEGSQIAGGDDGGLQKASSELHQGDHLVTTALWSEYRAALSSSAVTPPTHPPTTHPAGSLNQPPTLS